MTRPPRSRYAVKRRQDVALSTDMRRALRRLIDEHLLLRETDARDQTRRSLEEAATEYLMLAGNPHLSPAERNLALARGRKHAVAMLDWIREYGQEDTVTGQYIRSGIEAALAGQDPFAPGFISETTAWNHYKGLRHGLAVLIVAVNYLTTTKRKESQAQTGPLEYLIGALQLIWKESGRGRPALRNNIKDNPVTTPFRCFVDDVIRIVDPKALRRVEHAGRALNAGQRQAVRDAWVRERRERKKGAAEERELPASQSKRKPTKEKLREIERQMERIFAVPTKPAKRDRTRH